MRKPRRTKTASKPAKGWRLAAVLLALVTFAIQNYVTQTHIHFEFAASDGMAVAHALTPSGKHPFKETPANCPICQEIAMAGQFVTPVAAVFALPSQSVSIAPLEVAVRFIVEAVSHDWHGRGPPQS